MMSPQSIILSFGLLFSILSPVTAQTWTSCNPLNSTDCPSDISLGMTKAWNFTETLSDKIWNTTAGTITYGTDGGAFTIDKRYDSPTIQSNFYIFFGIVEIHMKAASGTGVISSIVLESDDLDEVDWEFLGGNSTHVESNYFGKGNTTSFDRAIYHPVDNPQENFYNYTVHWTADKIDWYIESKLVRTLPYASANDGKNFPQTPMNVRLGIWSGGDASNSNGTIEWAGGLTDYDKGPYTMTVQSAKVTDFGTGSKYTYGDKTGSWQSIKSTA
jgi:beta-glucanase (GH16 family)